MHRQNGILRRYCTCRVIEEVLNIGHHNLALLKHTLHARCSCRYIRPESISPYVMVMVGKQERARSVECSDASASSYRPWTHDTRLRGRICARNTDHVLQERLIKVTAAGAVFLVLSVRLIRLCVCTSTVSSSSLRTTVLIPLFQQSQLESVRG